MCVSDVMCVSECEMVGDICVCVMMGVDVWKCDWDVMRDGFLKLVWLGFGIWRSARRMTIDGGAWMCEMNVGCWWMWGLFFCKWWWFECDWLGIFKRLWRRWRWSSRFVLRGRKRSARSCVRLWICLCVCLGIFWGLKWIVCLLCWFCLIRVCVVVLISSWLSIRSFWTRWVRGRELTSSVIRCECSLIGFIWIELIMLLWIWWSSC